MIGDGLAVHDDCASQASHDVTFKSAFENVLSTALHANDGIGNEMHSRASRQMPVMQPVALHGLTADAECPLSYWYGGLLKDGLAIVAARASLSELMCRALMLGVAKTREWYTRLCVRRIMFNKGDFYGPYKNLPGRSQYSIA